MKLFKCDNCAQTVFFENNRCERCGYALGFDPARMRITTLIADDRGWHAHGSDEHRLRYCQNSYHQVCNWLLPDDPAASPFCLACRLNRMIPDFNRPDQLSAWQDLEAAKKRVCYSLLRLGLPLADKASDPSGLTFDFLSDPLDNWQPRVMTGHDRGVITLNVAEADSVYRERARKHLGEPYRTLVGHFRHELGHYYWMRLIGGDPERLAAFRGEFGDERKNYFESLTDYHAAGPPAGWEDAFISAYASSHPWEDWAETWAHYLHLVDTLETAHSFGLSLHPHLKVTQKAAIEEIRDPFEHRDFEALIEACVPLVLAINSLNRGMGLQDLYPFVIPPAAVAKMRFVHQLIVSNDTIR